MKIVSIVSARPNFVKLASVAHALQKKDVEHIIIHTGQHHNPLFSDVFFEELALPEPTMNLGITGGSNEETVEKTQEACLTAYKEVQPDMIVVYGDVSGALGAARAAHKLDIPFAHVESGLRSFDESMPEERNRKEIDHIAKLLFVTEKSGIQNLESENMKGTMHFVGNTMIDTIMRMHSTIEAQDLPPNLPGNFGVVTLHRPSNVDTKEDLKRNIAFLNEVAEACPLVFPMHVRTKNAMEHHELQNALSDDVQVIPPLGYLPFLKVVSQAKFILTDSGGIQEEAVFLQKKCFTLRKNTERPSTIESGSNTLIDLAKEEDRKKVLSFCKNPQALTVTVPELWDGRAGERIAEILSEQPES